jgi:predicted site-specific integrase-resolvase
MNAALATIKAERKRAPKLVPLAAWAEIVFGDFAPHVNTLHRWVHEGRIHPRPQKVGKNWFVSPTAEYQV